MDERQHQPATRSVVTWIVLGVVLWGTIHAIGATLLNHNPWRGVMVLSCVAAFLGCWLLLLRSRRRQRGA